MLDRLEREGALIEVKDHEHAVGHCQRCSTVVEPLVSTQVFVRIGPLAKPAIDVVREGKITFVPENWTKTYFEWMNNIQPWCISRQLWWGHQIPAWYGPDKKYFVAENLEEASLEAYKYYLGVSNNLSVSKNFEITCAVF